MAFYDLSKPERGLLVAEIRLAITADLQRAPYVRCRQYCADEDTYIRKAAYLSAGRIWSATVSLREQVLQMLCYLFPDLDPKVRQTVVNAAGEIGKYDFECVCHFFDLGLKDAHHSVRNAVIGSVKKMGEVNPEPVLAWAAAYLQHPDKEIRREICHGIELRGRKYPEDILPLLQQLEWDPTARVRHTLVHVLGQIAYKKGCLETVIAHLRHWDNKTLVAKAIEEIIDVHYRYRNFSWYTQEQAREYVIQAGMLHPAP